MNLQRVVPTAAQPTGQRIRCVCCQQWRPLEALLADLDGVAFVDYYCDTCKPADDGIVHL